MACARLAKPTGVFCFRSHPVKVARVGSSMAIPIAECRPCICFSPGMCCPDDRAPWRAHCQFFYPFSMGTCTKVGGIPYLFRSGEDCLLVEPHKADQIAQAVTALHQDRALRSKVVEAGYMTVMHHTLEEERDRMLRVLRD